MILLWVDGRMGIDARKEIKRKGCTVRVDDDDREDRLVKFYALFS